MQADEQAHALGLRPAGAPWALERLSCPGKLAAHDRLEPVSVGAAQHVAQVGIGAARAVISREVDLRFLTDGERVETAGMERRALPERQGKEQRVASPLSTHRVRPVAERSGVDAFGSERKGGDPVAFIMYLTVWTGIGLELGGGSEPA